MTTLKLARMEFGRTKILLVVLPDGVDVVAKHKAFKHQGYEVLEIAIIDELLQEGRNG